MQTADTNSRTVVRLLLHLSADAINCVVDDGDVRDIIESLMYTVSVGCRLVILQRLYSVSCNIYNVGYNSESSADAAGFFGILWIVAKTRRDPDVNGPTA